MTTFQDKLSFYFLRAVDILILKNPTRTGLGLVLGLVFSFAVRLFRPFLRTLNCIDIDAVPSWGWIPFGVLLVHLPYCVTSVFRKPKVDDETDEIIALIEAADFSEHERRQAYRSLVNQCISNVSLSRDFSRKMVQSYREIVGDAK